MDPSIILFGTASPPIVTTGLAGPSPTDFSLWALFLRADEVVKAVMIGLVLASVWSWAIILDRGWRLRKLMREADRFEDVFWSGTPLEELYNQLGHKPNHPLEVVFVAAMREWRRSSDQDHGQFLPGIRERIDKVMTVMINRELNKTERGLGFLATVGSTAPFVGLFGTVWGIMNAFQAIAVTKDTNLAVVAPGIAEALFATALGLLAAIPAVVAYNRFSNEVSRFSSRLDGFADEFSAILSRQIDERSGGNGGRF